MSGKFFALRVFRLGTVKSMAMSAGAVLAVAMLMVGTMARAQEFRATLSGAVTDPTGAVVAGATVEVRESNTGTVNRTVSDAAGQYVVPFLLPGDYSVTIKAPNFKTVSRKGITVQAQEHPIVNVALPLGVTSDTVTVTSDVPLVDQSNASVGQVISTESVEDLPLNGRTPTTLTELSVGVITTAAPQIVHPFDNNAGNSFSLGGTPNQVSEVLLDGSPDLTLLGALAYAPTQDSVQEVSVRPFDTDASFGHTIGGVVNQITKQGTNQIHGTAYEFYQTAGLDANLYFNKRATPATVRPNAHFHQYGGTVGGPMFIPKVFDGRNKLFFFFAYEGLHDSTPNTQALSVPTVAERAGDFSALLAAGCTGGGYTVNPGTGLANCTTGGAADPNQIYNPFNASLVAGKIVRTPIANNQVGSVGPLNSISKAYLALIPLPNTTGAASGQNNYISGAPSVDRYSNEFGRLDYNIGSKDHIFGDFRHNYRTQVKNDFFGNGATGTTLLRENFGLTIDNVYTLNSSTILDTRVNWTLFNEVHGTPAQKYNAASVGFPASLQAASPVPQLPCINFTNSTTVGTCGTNTTSFATLGDNTSSFDPTTNYQVFVDVVKVLGKHTLKVGFDGRQYRLSVQNFGNAAGTFNFGNNFDTAGTGSTTPTFGGDLADFYLGLATAGQFDLNSRADYHTYYIGSFIQDDWRVSNKLTLNMGVRFDIDTPFREKNGATVNGFNPTAVNSASASATAAFKPTTQMSNGQGTTIAALNTLGGLSFPNTPNGAPYATNSGFVSPRFGFSYSPDTKTVLRGGFGIFVQPETLASLGATGSYSSNALSNQQGFSASTQYAASTNNFQTPTGSLNNPFPAGFTQPAGSSAGASTFLGQSISFLAPVQHDPYSERFDLGIQRSLTNSTLLEVLYVGNHSVHLPIASQNLNATKLQYLTTNPYRDQSLATAYGTAVANPFAGLLPAAAAFNGTTTTFSNLLGAYPQFGNAAVNIQNQTIGQSYFHSALVHLEQRSKHGLTVTANYSFSKLTEADTFLNDQDTMPTHRISPYDHTHHFTTGVTYNLPFGKGKAFNFGGNRLLDEVFGGFVVNAIYQIQTGAPVSFTADIPLAPGATLKSITTNKRNTSPPPSVAGAPGNPALNTAAFVTGFPTTLGPATVLPATCAANPSACDGSTFVNNPAYAFHYRTLPQTISSVRIDGFNNLDASVLKNFAITNQVKLQLRFETFNTLNHAVFAAPNVTSATAANFGYITSVFANSQPRQIQLGGRLVF